MTNAKDLESATTRELIEALKGGALPREQLQAALSNALERIAILEDNWDELGQILRVFNDQMAAARVHGAGILKDQ